MPRYKGTCFRFYTQRRVEKNKAFAYRIYSHFTQQCIRTFLTKESLPSVVVTLSLLKYIYGTRLKNPLKRNRTILFLVYMVGVKATSKVDEMKSDRTRVTTQFLF